MRRTVGRGFHLSKEEAFGMLLSSSAALQLHFQFAICHNRYRITKWGSIVSARPLPPTSTYTHRKGYFNRCSLRLVLLFFSFFFSLLVLFLLPSLESVYPPNCIRGINDGYAVFLCVYRNKGVDSVLFIIHRFYCWIMRKIWFWFICIMCAKPKWHNCLTHGCWSGISV